MKLFNIPFVVVMAVLVSPGFVSAADSVWDTPSESMPSNTAAPEIEVYHSPTCKCCKGWIEHLEKHDFKVNAIPMDDVSIIKQQQGLPQNMASCHTAIIDGYVIEGHVPADDIKRLLKKRPKNVAGLSVPRMPVGTPGMEMGARKDPFNVIAFDKTGNTKVFKEYRSY